MYPLEPWEGDRVLAVTLLAACAVMALLIIGIMV
jgi:hypothetical protein